MQLALLLRSHLSARQVTATDHRGDGNGVGGKGIMAAKGEKKKKGGEDTAAPKRKLTPLDILKIIVFIPFFAPRWLYNKCEREGKLVLLSGVCTLALGVIFACMVVVMAWGEMEDMGGAIGCIGAGLVLIGAHFA